MKRLRWIVLAATVAAGSQLGAGEMDFPEIFDPGIPGTPRLGQPMLVMGDTKPILTEKHGLAAPALWDWNGDSKRDLLVGEFETNSGEDFPMRADGSTIRVYLNVGTDDDPRFTDEFAWARDTEGTIMEVPQWCCIGFTPQFVDLDDDGHLDMITGQYHPGDVTWFRGTGDGFLPGETLPQEGDPSSNGQPMFGNYEGEPGDIGTFHYWVYTSASFGDFDDDGDHDLIVGGSGGLRISENIGSPRRPSFAMRELLLRHQGRIYVMLGEQRESAPVTVEALPSASPERRSASTAPANPPVALAFVSPDEVLAGERANLAVSFTMRPGWYIYAPTGRNEPHGMIETSVSFGLPEGIETAGSRSLPVHHFKGLYDIYEGSDRQWAQPLQASAAGSYEVTAKVTYQTCKDDLCLPPRTETLRTRLAVVDAGG